MAQEKPTNAKPKDGQADHKQRKLAEALRRNLIRRKQAAPKQDKAQ